MEGTDKTKEIAEKTAELEKIERKLEDLRKKYEKDEAFAKYESYRDEGVDLARLKSQEMRFLRKDMQMIFQDPYSSLNPRMTVGQIIGEGLLAHGIFKKNDEKMQAYVMEVMGKMWIGALYDSQISTSIFRRSETDNRNKSSGRIIFGQFISTLMDSVIGRLICPMKCRKLHYSRCRIVFKRIY